MNSDEMVLTIHIRHLSKYNGVTEKELFKSIKNSARLINERRENNYEPYAGCPCKCTVNLSCAQCWARAIARFTCVENNIPNL